MAETPAPARERVALLGGSLSAEPNILGGFAVSIARGWFRQDDFPQNRVLYRRLGRHAYLHWLRKLGVRYVVLSAAPPDYSARAEATLIRSGRSGLNPVHRTAALTIYAVPRPRPIISGPGSPTLFQLTQDRIGATVGRAGSYRIAVRWSPYWRASDGCLRRGAGGMLRLETRAARRITIRFRVDTTHALDQLVGEQPTCRLPARPEPSR